MSRANVLVALLGLAAAAGAGPALAVTWAELAPIVNQRCTLCHSGDAAAAGLRLDSLEGLLRGSGRGPVVKAGDPAGSELVRRLKGLSQPRMPMTGPPFLPEADVANFERWIAGGLARGDAAGAPGALAVAPPARPGPGEPVTWRHVAPLLATRCAKCHTDGGLMGAAPEGYRLNALANVLAASDRARVVPGLPGASELLRRVKGQARPRMPFDGPPWLSDDEVGLIEAWIAQGARDSEGRAAPVPVGAVVRLHGTLDAAGGLDGLRFATGARLRVDRSPAPGDAVELRGRLDATGQVQAERLRRR